MAEPFIQWSDEVACGIRAIDNDHRMLFEVVNTLDAAVRADDPEHDIGGVLERLKRYVIEHFAREERFMADGNFPDYAAHAREHRRLAEIVQAIEFAYDTAPDSIDVEKVLDFLAQWLTVHILVSDHKYIPYVKGEVGAGEPEADAGEPSHGRRARTVQYTLPADKADLLEICARALASDDDRSRDLEQMLQGLATHYPTERIASVAKSFLKDGAELPGVE